MAPDNQREKRKHYYHAEASAVHGDLKLPYRSRIERQAHAQVKPTGGYESQQGKPFRVEGIVSYCGAHTQVAGHLEDQEKKPDRGYKTLSTSLVENLNILNVVTADRVVAQISTEHPLYEDEGHVPHVTFLGSQFHNLRIGGYPVEVELDLDLFDPDKHDCKLAFTRNEAFLQRLADRVNIFRTGAGNISADLQKRYGRGPFTGNGKECTEFSIVKAIRTNAPWKPIGNVFDIPQFGQVHLGVVRIEHSDHEEQTPKTTVVEVSMIEAVMGCIASGTVVCASGKTNGGSTPPTG
jgi:hypothetical protein